MRKYLLRIAIIDIYVDVEVHIYELTKNQMK